MLGVAGGGGLPHRSGKIILGGKRLFGPFLGIVDKAGEFTGDCIAFVYPDLSTALVGKYAGGVMISAMPARLETVDMVGGIATPSFSVQERHPVSFCLSTQDSLGDNPPVRDPYEDRTCKVNDQNQGSNLLPIKILFWY